MSRKKSDERHSTIANLAPANWDNRAASIAGELRNFLKSIVDEGSSIDSGMGDNFAELWPHVDGIEYHVVVTFSRELPPSQTTEAHND